jgi:hypothetical protein
MKVLLHLGSRIDDYKIPEDSPPAEVEIRLFPPFAPMPDTKVRFCLGGRADGMPLYRLMMAKVQR